MLNPSVLIPLYPDVWQAAGFNEDAFLSMLAAYGQVSWSDVTQWRSAQLSIPSQPAAMPSEPLKDYAAQFPDLWLAYGRPESTFIKQLYNNGLIGYAELLRLGKAIGASALAVDAEAAGREEVGDALFEKQKSYFGTAFRSVLESFWAWLKSTVGDIFTAIWEFLKRAFDTAMQTCQAVLGVFSRATYDGVFKMLAEIGQVTPERATEVALKLYNFAYEKGVEAHLVAMGVELIHPYKSLGIQQIPAMVGDYAGFGAIAGATIGVVQRLALAKPMQYAVNAHCRPQLPDDGLLQTLAVKKDITMEQFRSSMRYTGYNDYWIGRIEATMYREPMYRELLMMAESDVATDSWMVDKLERSGYEVADAHVMHKAILKRIALTQRNSYYTQAYNLFKDGFCTQDLFEKILDELELRPEAKHFAVASAKLAYLNDVTKEQITYWQDSYAKDLISDDELRLHLTLIGVVPERVWLLGQIAKVKKYKKPAAPTTAQLDSVTKATQSKLSQAYVMLYKKDLIGSEDLVAYLIQIGINPDLAEATAFLEEARRIA